MQAGHASNKGSGKFSILRQEFCHRICRFVKLNNMRVLPDQFIYTIIKRYPVEKLIRRRLAMMQFIVPSDLGFKKRITGPSLVNCKPVQDQARLEIFSLSITIRRFMLIPLARQESIPLTILVNVPSPPFRNLRRLCTCSVPSRVTWTSLIFPLSSISAYSSSENPFVTKLTSRSDSD